MDKRMLGQLVTVDIEARLKLFKKAPLHIQ